jgi:predicted AAA+ superfamily ATPase
VILRRLGDAQARRAILVRGPRQVGKTILLLQLAGSLLASGWPRHSVTYFDFSDPANAGVSPAQVVEAAISFGPATGARPVFLFDEIARVERWDLWLKQAVDRGSGRFVVTDSSAHVLRSGGRESGQGRWDDFALEPLTFREFVRLAYGTATDPTGVLTQAIARYLAIGGFPEHVRAEDMAVVRRRMRQDLCEKAVQAELLRADVDVARAQRLFVYLVQRSGAILVPAGAARDLGADQRAVAKWLALLEDLMLVVQLPRAATPRVAMRSHARFYAADHGMVAAFADSADPLADGQARGSLCETVVFRHLREVVREGGGRLFYYRGNGAEIDFVMDIPGGKVAIEVTGDRAPGGDKVARARAAAEAAGASRALLIHGGNARGATDGVHLVPLHAFLVRPQLVAESLR